MRILFYSHAPEFGGAERSLLSLMLHAADAGHEILLCTPPGPLMEAAPPSRIALRRMPPFEVGYTRNPAQLLLYLRRSLRPVRELARAIHQFVPDVIHANTTRSGLVAARAVIFAPIRPTLVVHARDALERGRIDRLVASVIGSQADAIIAISHFVAESLQLDRTQVRVLHNAIDPQDYRRDEAKGERLRHRLGIRSSVPLLAVAGQITPWKGQLEAIAAFAVVRKRYPEAQLLLAGSVKFTGSHRRFDNVKYRRDLVTRSQEPDVAGYVHLIDEINDASAIYSAANVLLVPSWKEPFGRVVIEAMAAECPVVATAAGGVPEIIEHDVEGLLVPPYDSVALGWSALDVLSDSTLAARLVEHGRQRVAGHFTMQRYMQQIEAMWAAARSDGAMPYPGEPPRNWAAGREGALRLPGDFDAGPKRTA